MVAGSVGLTFSGGGTLVLSGDNTYSGGTNLNAGTLVLSNTSATAGTGTLSLANGTTLMGPAGPC